MQEAKSQMEARNPTVSITTLNMKGLNSLIRMQKLLDWIRKHDSTLCCPQDANFRSVIQIS